MAVKKRISVLRAGADYAGHVEVFSPLTYVSLTHKQTKKFIKELQAALIKSKEVAAKYDR